MSGTATISWINMTPAGVTLDLIVDNIAGSDITVNSVSGVTSFSPAFTPLADGTSYTGTVNGSSPITISIYVSGIGFNTDAKLVKNLALQQTFIGISTGAYAFNPISVLAGDDILVEIESQGILG